MKLAAIGIHLLSLCLLCGLSLPVLAAPTDLTSEKKAIEAVLARFYEGWNEHDADKMVSVYADDVDHINVFAQWHRGKSAIKEDLTRFHAGPAKNSRKTYTIEKIRFIKPDVAVIQVRSLSTVGNLGTYVMSKDSGDWLVVSFTNVSYDLAAAKSSSSPQPSRPPE